MKGPSTTSHYKKIIFKSIFQIIRLLNIKKIMRKLLLFMVPTLLRILQFDKTTHLGLFKLLGLFNYTSSYSRTYLIRKSNISSFNCDFDRKFYNLKIVRIQARVYEISQECEMTSHIFWLIFNELACSIKLCQ